MLHILVLESCKNEILKLGDVDHKIHVQKWCAPYKMSTVLFKMLQIFWNIFNK